LETCNWEVNQRRFFAEYLDDTVRREVTEPGLDNKQNTQATDPYINVELKKKLAGTLAS
jgi:hypothetical protein